MKPTRYLASKAAIPTVAAQRYAKRHTEIAAIRQTRGVIAAASAELINTAAVRFIMLCYEHDSIIDDFANVDAVTWRILFPVPWGRHSYRWHLTSSEARIMRYYVMSLQYGSLSRHYPPAFIFDAAVRRWYLNLQDHPISKSAMDYWQKVEMNAKRFVSIARQLRQER